MISLDILSHNRNAITIGAAVFAQVTAMGRPFPQIAPSMEDLKPHLTHDSLSLQPKRHLDWFSRFCTDDCRVSLALQWDASPPSKSPLPIGASGSPSNTWFPGPNLVLKPSGISIDSAVFAGLTSVTDRQTDKPHYWVGNNRPHLRSTGDAV